MFARSHPVAAAFVTAALCVASIPVARAAEGEPGVSESLEDPEALSAAAVEAFHAKDYEGAIALFERAYELDPQPNYKFNIGRVYEEKGDLDKAIAYYQEFVKSPGVDLAARESASERLEILRKAAKALEEDEPPPEPPKDDGAALMPTDSEPEDEGLSPRKRKLRIAGYSLLGVGGVGLVLGAVFGGLALSKSRDADNATLIDDKLALREDAKVRANAADGLFIAGGIVAAVGLGLVLATVGKGGKRSSRASFTPTFGPRGAGLAWAGRF